jgi:hypothetical protein
MHDLLSMLVLNCTILIKQFLDYDKIREDGLEEP